jgi:hypothetical protein
MKRHQFTTIEQVREAHDLLRGGVIVATRKQGFYKIELYQLPGMYMEVYRHSHFNVIIRINRFTDTEYLEPYLTSIDVESLFH